MTLTIEIPETIVEQLRAEAAAHGEDLNNYAIAKLAQPLYFASEDEWIDTDEEDDADRIAALRQGIADRKAGRLHTFDELDAAVEAALADSQGGSRDSSTLAKAA